MVDAGAKENQQNIELERIAAQERIAGMQAGIKAESDKTNLVAKQQVEGLRIGSEIARNKAQMANQSKQTAQQRAQQPKKESD